jgi:hypothetical protein
MRGIKKKFGLEGRNGTWHWTLSEPEGLSKLALWTLKSDNFDCHWKFSIILKFSERILWEDQHIEWYEMWTRSKERYLTEFCQNLNVFVHLRFEHLQDIWRGWDIGIRRKYSLFAVVTTWIDGILESLPM